MNKTKILIFTLILAISLAACMDPQPPPTLESPAIVAPGGAEPAPVEQEPSAGPVEAPVPDQLRELPPVQGALADLSGEINIPASEIEVVSVEEVTWPDSGLGCGQPGSAYLQVITPGYQVLLEAAGRQYVYHTDTDRAVVLCKEVVVNEKPGPPGVIEPGLEPFIDQAVADLAGRLSVRAVEIEVLEAKLMVWPDGSLGCPQPGMRYIQVLQEGYLIRLGFGSQAYAYHGGGGRPPFLCEQSLDLMKKTPGARDELVPPPGFDD